MKIKEKLKPKFKNLKIEVGDYKLRKEDLPENIVQAQSLNECLQLIQNFNFIELGK